MIPLMQGVMAGLMSQPVIVQEQPQRQIRQLQKKQSSPIENSWFGGSGYTYPFSRINRGFKKNRRVELKQTRSRKS